VSPSYLSRVLNGKRNISAPVASKLSHFLNLTPEEESHFLRLIARDQIDETESIRLGIQRRLESAKSSNPKTISTEDFKTISEWYYFAILSLAGTKDFKSNPQWIARRLGIDPETAGNAFAHLLRLGYFKIENGNYRADESANIETPPGVASTAVRENHRQHLALAANALQEIPLELREFVNCGVPMKVADVASAKKRIQNFFDGFIKDMDRTPGDEVFQLNIQFYQLTKTSRPGIT
jgi:uncharacterized protein (TIGR02147 family)